MTWFLPSLHVALMAGWYAIVSARMPVNSKYYFALIGVGDIARVAEGAFRHSTSRMDSIDPKLEVVDVVQRVEDAEDINPRPVRSTSCWSRRYLVTTHVGRAAIRSV